MSDRLHLLRKTLDFPIQFTTGRLLFLIGIVIIPQKLIPIIFELGNPADEPIKSDELPGQIKLVRKKPGARAIRKEVVIIMPLACGITWPHLIER